MKVLVCGSRDWTSDKHQELIWVTLTLFNATREDKSELVIIQGEAKGADRAAKEWARANLVKCLSFKPDWSKGKWVGLARNTDMLNENPDLVIVFTNQLVNPETGLSSGTGDTVKKAEAKGIPVKVYSEADIAEFYQNDLST